MACALLTPCLRAGIPQAELAPAVIRPSRPALDDLEIFPPRSYAHWRCPDRNCSANRPGLHLHLRAWAWAKGDPNPDKRPRCQRCGQEQVYIPAPE